MAVVLVLASLAIGYIAGRRRPVDALQMRLWWMLHSPMSWRRMAWMVPTLVVIQPNIAARAVWIWWHRRRNPQWTQRPVRGKAPIPTSTFFGPKVDE